MSHERVPKKSEIKRALEQKGMLPGDTVWYMYPHYYAVPQTVRLFIVFDNRITDITQQVAQLLDVEYSDGTRAIALDQFAYDPVGDEDVLLDASVEGEDVVRFLSIKLYECLCLKSAKV